MYLLKKYESIVQKTMRKWRFKTLSNALDGWISKVAETKRHRQLLARASRRWQNKVVAAVYTRWFEYTAERKETELKLQGFWYKLRNKSVVQTFKTWQEMLFEVKRHRNMVARAAGNGVIGPWEVRMMHGMNTFKLLENIDFWFREQPSDGSKGQCLLHTRVGMNCATGENALRLF